MKRFIQFVGRLYPASWRRRYGIEFAALLDDATPDWRTFLNVLRGALAMQMRTWNFGKILAVAGIAGALLGLAAWFAMPSRYASLAVLEVEPSPLSAGQAVTSDVVVDYVSNLARQSMSRPVLTKIIRTFNLYEPELANIPREEVVDRMKKNITIAPVGRKSDSGITAFCIRFTYSDPVAAQQVAQELVARFLASNTDFSLQNKPSTGGVIVKVLDPANLQAHPFSPRVSTTMTVGTAAGLALGVLLALFRRTSRSGRSIETR